MYECVLDHAGGGTQSRGHENQHSTTEVCLQLYMLFSSPGDKSRAAWVTCCTVLFSEQ